MIISEVIRQLTEFKEEHGDVEVIMLTGKWHDCRSKDWKWPIVDSIEPLTFQQPKKVAICSEYNEPKGDTRFGL
jgi:hypothetical protein